MIDDDSDLPLTPPPNLGPAAPHKAFGAAASTSLVEMLMTTPWAAGFLHLAK